MPGKNSPYYFYLFRCKDGSLYAGIAKDAEARERLHNAGKGSKYVAAKGGGKIIYKEKYTTINGALRREREVKKWPKAKKEVLALMKQNRYN